MKQEMGRDSHGHLYLYEEGHYVHRTVQGKEYTFWAPESYLVVLEDGGKILMTPEEFAAHNEEDWPDSGSGDDSGGDNPPPPPITPTYNPGGTITPTSGETGYNYIYRFFIPKNYVSGETRPLKIQVKQAATSNGEYTSGITEQWITVYPPRTKTRVHATYPNSLRVNVDEGTICIYSIQDGEITLTIPEDNISSAGTPTVIEL
jgi:hypothetical protein